MLTIKKLKKFACYKHKSILLQALYCYLIAYLLLKLTSFSKLSVWLEKFSANLNTKQAISREQALEAMEIIKNNLPGMSNCLLSSITFYLLFKKYFANLDLILGVNNTEGFKAHAWLENNQEVFWGQDQEIQFENILRI